MKRILIKILFRLLGIPTADRLIDQDKIKEWLGLQYPLKPFRDYIGTRSFLILQKLGEGVNREDYLMYVGQRIELGKLLTEAKTNFEKAERKRAEIRRKRDENTKNKKG